MSKLTKQEKKFVKIKAETGNGTLAAKKAFGIQDSNCAGVKAYDLLRNPKIISALEEALPDELLLEVHREGLSATRGIDGNIELPDYAVRHKYLDTAYKLRGSYAPDKHVTLNIEAEPSEKVKELIHAFTHKRGTTTTD